MKKILTFALLLTIMLIGGSNSAKAQEVDVTTLPWVNKSQACTVDLNNPNAGTAFGTDAGGTQISYVDLSAYGQLNMTGAAGQRVRLFLNRAEAGDTNGIFYVDFDGDGNATFDFNTVLTAQPKAQYIHLNGIKASAWNTHADISTITVSGSAITFPEIFEIPEGEYDITKAAWVNQGQGCTDNIGKEIDAVIYGTDAGPNNGNLSYFDASAYGQIKIYGRPGDVYRLFINRAEYPSNFQFNVTVGAEGCGTLNLVDVYNGQGCSYIHINGIKTNWAKVNTKAITMAGEAPTVKATEGSIMIPTAAPWYEKVDGEYVSAPATPAKDCCYQIATAEPVGCYYGVINNGENCNHYADLSAYASIRVYQDKTNTPRAMFFKKDASGQKQFNFTWNEAGYFELDIQNAIDDAEIQSARLISIRAQQFTTYVAKDIQFILKPENVSVNYYLTGNGSLALSAAATAALADVNAKVIDATGVTGTGVELVSANPNCIFLANVGVLANEENVCVAGTINKLALTDGKPFALPAEATAVADASYDRTFTAAYSTVCLPFAATFEGDAYAYTEKSDNTVTFTKVEGNELTAGKAYLVKAGFAVTGGSGAMATEPEASAFTGTFESQVLTSGDTTYYGFSGGTFVKVGENVNVKPFRAYLALDGVALSKLAVSFIDEEATDAAVAEAQATKVLPNKFISDGKFVITKNGKAYNAVGAEK